MPCGKHWSDPQPLTHRGGPTGVGPSVHSLPATATGVYVAQSPLYDAEMSAGAVGVHRVALHWRGGAEKVGPQLARAAPGGRRKAIAKRPAATPGHCSEMPGNRAGKPHSECSKQGVDHVLFLLRMSELCCLSQSVTFASHIPPLGLAFLTCKMGEPDSPG